MAGRGPLPQFSQVAAEGPAEPGGGPGLGLGGGPPTAVRRLELDRSLSSRRARVVSVVSLAESKPRSAWVHGELKARARAERTRPPGLRERGAEGLPAAASCARGEFFRQTHLERA